MMLDQAVKPITCTLSVGIFHIITLGSLHAYPKGVNNLPCYSLAVIKLHHPLRSSKNTPRFDEAVSIRPCDTRLALAYERGYSDFPSLSVLV